MIQLCNPLYQYLEIGKEAQSKEHDLRSIMQQNPSDGVGGPDLQLAIYSTFGTLLDYSPADRC